MIVYVLRRDVPLCVKNRRRDEHAGVLIGTGGTKLSDCPRARVCMRTAMQSTYVVVVVV